MKYLIKNKDGSVSIMNTVGGATPEECLAKWHPSEKIKVESHRAVNDSEIPDDRYFRDAWSHKLDKIEVDMPKAMDIHLGRLREMRKPKLEALDIESMRAIEEDDKDKQRQIAADKKALRDVTISPDVLNASTPEELKNAVPSILR